MLFSEVKKRFEKLMYFLDCFSDVKETMKADVLIIIGIIKKLYTIK